MTWWWQSADPRRSSFSPDGTHFILSGPPILKSKGAVVSYSFRRLTTPGKHYRRDLELNIIDQKNRSVLSNVPGFIICVHGIGGFHLVFEELAQVLNDAVRLQ